MSDQELASAAMKATVMPRRLLFGAMMRKGIKVEPHLSQRHAGVPRWSHQEKARDLDLAGSDRFPDQLRSDRSRPVSAFNMTPIVDPQEGQPEKSPGRATLLEEKRGIGRVLFGAAVTHAKGIKAGAIIIYAEPSAEGFYKRMGAIRIGEGTVLLLARNRTASPPVRHPSRGLMCNTSQSLVCLLVPLRHAGAAR